MSAERVHVAINYYRENPGVEMLAVDNVSVIATHFPDLTHEECEQVRAELASSVRAAAGGVTAAAHHGPVNPHPRGTDAGAAQEDPPDTGSAFNMPHTHPPTDGHNDLSPDIGGAGTWNHVDFAHPHLSPPDVVQASTAWQAEGSGDFTLGHTPQPNHPGPPPEDQALGTALVPEIQNAMHAGAGTEHHDAHQAAAHEAWYQQAHASWEQFTVHLETLHRADGSDIPGTCTAVADALNALSIIQNQYVVPPFAEEAVQWQQLADQAMPPAHALHEAAQGIAAAGQLVSEHWQQAIGNRQHDVATMQAVEAQFVQHCADARAALTAAH